MSDDLKLAVEAMRAEFRRQADEGNATYHGLATDGSDGLQGYFDLVKVARAALNAASPPQGD